MGYSSVNVTLNDPMGNIGKLKIFKDHILIKFKARKIIKVKQLLCSDDGFKLLPNCLGGSLRTHQRPPRVDVRDIFNRAHSVSTSDMRTQDQRQRDQIRNAHTELQRYF